jgi:hypothetical protein
VTYMSPETPGRPVAVEVTTAGYRISGTVRTRFDRVASVLNNLDLSHLTVELATVSELYDPGQGKRVESVLISLDEILFLMADMPEERMTEQIIVPKRPVHALIGIPPFELKGTLFVPESVTSVGTALTMTPDAFVPMIDVEVTTWIRAELNHAYPVVAFQRRLVHVMSFEEGARVPLSGLRPSADTGW